VICARCPLLAAPSYLSPCGNSRFFCITPVAPLASTHVRFNHTVLCSHSTPRSFLCEYNHCRIHQDIRAWKDTVHRSHYDLYRCDRKPIRPHPRSLTTTPHYREAHHPASTMKSAVAFSAAAAVLSGTADAFWRMPCTSRTALGRIDPIVDFGVVSSHGHTIHGGSSK
jgi:hypothetical protein